MKKKIIGLILVLALVICACIVVVNKSITYDEKVDEAVSQALLSRAEDYYSEGECAAEGHIILGVKQAGKSIEVYALTMVGNYGFENGNFVKISGTGTIPAVITFKVIDNNYLFMGLKEPLDGALYTESIREMFPFYYYPRVFSISDSDHEKLETMERKYAEAYLKKIGRKAKIGDYADFEYTIETDVGISVDVSNKMLDYNSLGYPMHIGTCEQIEKGVRYVYEQEYIKSKNEIRFRKYNYETNEVVELIRVNSLTGKEITK